jgi:hypothetical protein
VHERITLAASDKDLVKELVQMTASRAVAQRASLLLRLLLTANKMSRGSIRRGPSDLLAFWNGRT